MRLHVNTARFDSSLEQLAVHEGHYDGSFKLSVAIGSTVSRSQSIVPATLPCHLSLTFEMEKHITLIILEHLRH